MENNEFENEEIAQLAAIADYSAHVSRKELAQNKKFLDDAAEDIFREYIFSDLMNWHRGEKITPEKSAKLIAEILERRREESNTLNELCEALMVFSLKFPYFIKTVVRKIRRDNLSWRK